MKKLLALVLALVMVLGLATVGASAADFKDDSSIEYAEAVDVMNGIGVIQGDDNGNFNPKGTLTREQAAKIVAYMLLGKQGADSLSAAGAPFDDVAADRWSAGAIAYCANEGIIAGLGNGQFNPEGKLTGHQFAKMLLVALGYNPKYENLQGTADWAVNVAKLAVSAGLEEDLSIVMSQEITRDQAAMMAFNTLKSDMVDYENPVNVKTGDGTEVNVGAKRFKTDDLRGSANIYDGRTEANEDVDKFCEVYFKDLKKVSTTNDFNEPCNQWSYKTKVISEEAKKADNVLVGSVTYQDLYNAAGSAAMGALRNLRIYVDGKLMSAALGLNGASSDAISAEAAGKFWTKDNDEDLVWTQNNASGHWGTTGAITSTLANPTGNGTVTSVFVDDISTTVGGAAVTRYDVNINIKHIYVGKVTSVSDDKVTISGKTLPSVTNNSATLDNEFKTKSFKKDDIVLYTVALNASNEAKIQDMELATLVSGVEVTKTSTEGTKPNKSVVTAGGKDYKLNINVKVESTINWAAINQFTAGDKFDLYLDDNGLIVFAEKTEEELNLNNYLVLVKAGSASGTATNLVADAVTLSGNKITNKTFTKYDGKSLTDWDQVRLFQVYKYSVNGSDYELKPVGSGYSTNSDSNFNYTGAATLVGGTVNSASKMFVYDIDDAGVKTYTGVKNFPNITAANGDGYATQANKGAGTWTQLSGTTNAKNVAGNALNTLTVAVATLTKNGNVLAAVVGHNSPAVGAPAVATSTSASDIIYITSKNYTTTKDGDDTVYTFDAIKEGKVTTVSTKSASVKNLFAQDQDLYQVTSYDGDYVDGVTPRTSWTDTSVTPNVAFTAQTTSNAQFSAIATKATNGVSSGTDDTTWGRVRFNKDATKADLQIGVSAFPNNATQTIYTVDADTTNGTFKLKLNNADNSADEVYVAVATNSNTKFFEISDKGVVTEVEASNFSYDALDKGEFSAIYDADDNVAQYIFYQKV